MFLVLLSITGSVRWYRERTRGVFGKLGSIRLKPALEGQMIAMAKKAAKTERKKGQTPPKKLIAAFKGTEKYAEWFEGLVELNRKLVGWEDLPASVVLEKALHCLAKQ